MSRLFTVIVEFRVHGKRRSSNFFELQFALLRGFCYTARAFGRKGGSRKLRKELTEMNRITTTLCVMAVLAMATLALPTPSYPSNAFSGFAEAFVCPKSRFSAAKVSYDLSSLDKMVVNSTTCIKRTKSLSRVGQGFCLRQGCGGRDGGRGTCRTGRLMKESRNVYGWLFRGDDTAKGGCP